MQQWGGEVRGLSYKLPRFFEQTYFLPIITYLKCKYSLKYYNNTFRSVLQTYIKILINISHFSFTTTAQLILPMTAPLILPLPAVIFFNY